MWTYGTFKHEKQLKSYFEQHLSSGDYYSDEGAIQGEWAGALAKELGLDTSKPISKRDFDTIVEGIHPNDPKVKLLQRRNETRTVAYDFVCSAPKSVSIMALVAKDDRLIKAHNEAAQLAFEEMQKLAQTRVRAGLLKNTKERRTTGKVLAAKFTHSTSRAIDPQLHTHFTTFNFTKDEVEGKWKALDMYEMACYLSVATEVYRHALLARVRELGYEIEQSDKCWRIKGVTGELEIGFSKRHQQIEKYALEHQLKTGEKLDREGRAIAAHLTRPKKQKGIEGKDLANHYRMQMAADMQELLKELVEKSKGRGPIRESHFKSTSQLIDFVSKSAFARKSVISSNEFEKLALQHSSGEFSYPDIRKAIDKNKSLVIREGSKGRYEILTTDELQRELALIKIVNKGVGAEKKLKAKIPEPLKKGLEVDQLEALNAIGRSKDSVQILKGSAGSGKSFLLKRLESLVGKDSIQFLAPTSGSTQNLVEDKLDAITMQKYLMSEIQSKKLIVLDEAGLVSTKQMHEFLAAAKKANSRVLLVGDPKQHVSVEAGDALRLLSAHSGVKTIQMAVIKRQKLNKEYLAAAEAMKDHDMATALQILDEKLGAITELEDTKRHKEAARLFMKSKASKQSTLIVTPTWKEAESITTRVRESLAKEGTIDLAKARKREVIRSLSPTEAEKELATTYSSEKKNLKVSFNKSSGAFRQGQVWNIEEVNATQNKVTLSLGKNQSVTINAEQLATIADIVEVKEAEFAPGDSIMLTANYASSPKNRIPNGSIIQVDEILTDGTLKTSTGKLIGPECRNLIHGYAITSHQSQSKTAENVIVSIDTKSKGSISANQVYVSATRGKTGIHILTDDKASLMKQAERSANRKLIHEVSFTQKMLSGLKDLEAARRLKGFIAEKERELELRRLDERAKVEDKVLTLGPEPEMA